MAVQVNRIIGQDPGKKKDTVVRRIADIDQEIMMMTIFSQNIQVITVLEAPVDQEMIEIHPRGLQQEIIHRTKSKSRKKLSI